MRPTLLIYDFKLKLWVHKVRTCLIKKNEDLASSEIISKIVPKIPFKPILTKDTLTL